jgi:proline-specific peptidase
MDESRTPVSSAREGRLPFRGWETWYKVVEGAAPAKAIPLLTLHGGPGIPHGYLDPLADLAADGRTIVFYDQLGCGESTRPHDPSLWSVDLFVEELDNVRAGLGLEEVHLLGQSWGGMLALDYALRRPSGLVSLVLADTAASMAQWVAEASRLRSELPGEVQRVLAEHEAAGTIDSPEYAEAMNAFYARHVCRCDPMPDCVAQAFAALEEDAEVYNTMWGPNEFTCTGTLKPWNVRERLGEIGVPTLVVSGRYDEATPAMQETLVRGIAGAEQRIFEHSSHLPHAEEPEAFRAVVADFLDRAEEGR